MSSFRPSSQSLKTTHKVVAKLPLLFAVFFYVAQDFSVSSVGNDQWIRLCTFTSNGSSLMNVTMPCGVDVRSELEDDYKDNTGVSESWREGDDSVEFVKITLDSGRTTTTPERQPGNLTTRQDGDSTTKHSKNKTSKGDPEEKGDVVDEGDVAEEGDVEEVGEVEEERDVKEEGDIEEEGEAEEEGNIEEEPNLEEGDEEKEKEVGTEAEDDSNDRDVEIDSVEDDEGQSTYDQEVTILNVETNGGASEEREDEISGTKDQLVNRLRGTAVTKVMLGYLLNARNQLYDKIHYLLNLLQRTFFNIKRNYRHRRNSIERRSLFNNKNIQGNIKNPLFSSMILEPTFERSMMTMSFLMFGVFVIQVVQKLMQTIHQPGENSFIGNSIFGNLPTASSNIF